jgi:hypothetical protein
MQVWLGDQKVWSGPNNNFPPETAGRCELSTSWERNPNTDLTAKLKAVEPGLEVPVKIRVSVTGSGEGYARIKVRFDPTKVNARISRLQPTDVRWSMVFQFVNPILPQALWLAYRLCVGVYK